MAKKNVETGLLPQVHYQMLQEPLLTWVLLIFFQIFSAEMCRTDEGLQRAHHVATTHNENEMA